MLSATIKRYKRLRASNMGNIEERKTVMESSLQTDSSFEEEMDSFDTNFNLPKIIPPPVCFSQ
jgi:hypothetical protein